MVETKSMTTTQEFNPKTDLAPAMGWKKIVLFAVLIAAFGLMASTIDLTAVLSGLWHSLVTWHWTATHHAATVPPATQPSSVQYSIDPAGQSVACDGCTTTFITN